MDCYFQDISGCYLTTEEIQRAPEGASGLGFNVYPLKNERILKMTGLPTVGKCSICGASWPVDSIFLDGLCTTSGMMPVGESAMRYEAVDHVFNHMKYFSAFASDIKIAWLSNMLRSDLIICTICCCVAKFQ